MVVDFKKLIRSWPVYRQLTGDDALGRGQAAQSSRSLTLTPRTAEADDVMAGVAGGEHHVAAQHPGGPGHE